MSATHRGGSGSAIGLAGRRRPPATVRARRTLSGVIAVLAALAVAAATLTAWAGQPAGGSPGAGRGTPPQAAQEEALEAFADMPLSFVANHGQTDPRVRYHAQGSDYAFYFTPERIMMSFTEDPRLPAGSASQTAPSARAINLALRFLGASADVEMGAGSPTDARVNYVRGDDPAGWHTGLPAYGEVVYRDLWPDVDMVLEGDGGELKYEFLVRPGARVRDIRLAYAGAQRLALDASGGLRIRTALGELHDGAPVSYQEIDGVRVPVESRYVLTKRKGKRHTKYGFAVGSYDRDHALVIDPALDYSTFVGGASMDRAEDVTVDADGNAIVVGTTQSEDFPTTAGAVDRTFNGGVVDVFVAKLKADGSGLVYATYLGGVPTQTPSGNVETVEFGRTVTVDGTGNAYVAGQTSSGDFPITAGAFQENQQVGQNTAVEGFVSKLDATGGLVYSTFLGGTGSDDVRSVAVDTDGNAYLAGGTTSSSNFPVTTGAFDTDHNGGEDVFVAKLNATGSALAYSTLLGGADNELANGIAVDSSGNAYVGGASRSVGFPSTAGVFQPDHSGGDFADLFEGFVTKLDPTGSGLVYSAFLGGAEIDRVDDLAIDAAGSAHVVGGTLSPGFPTTPGAFDTTFDDSSEGFVAKLSPDASALTYSTFLGVAAASSIAVDGETAWLGGDAGPGATTTADAFQATNNGGNDAYLARLDATGSDLLFATYLGGTDSEFATGIALDPLSNVYVAGTTFSGDFPTTPGAFDRVFDGDPSIFWGDAFAAKFAGDGTQPGDTTAPTVSITSPAAGATVSGTQTVAATASDDGAVAEVRFAVDGDPIGTDTTAPYEVSWDTTTVANGSHALTATALDTANNSGSAGPVTVTVDNLAAAEPVTTTFSGELRRNQTVTHTVSSGAGVVDWTLDWDRNRVDLDLEVRDPQGNLVDSDTSNARPKSGSFQAPVAGDYAFRIISNTRRDTDYTLSVTHPDPTVEEPPPADTVSPEVTITDPAAQSTVSGTVQVTATASDDVGVDRVQFVVDDSAVIATDTTAPYETSWDTTAFPDGLTSLTARAFDAAGNAGAHRIPVTIDNTAEPPADTTAPTVSITVPSDGETVSGTTSVTATASDDVGVSEVRFFADGSLIGTDTEAPYEVSWDTATVADGSHELTATALDAAGNAGDSAPVTVTVDNTAEPPADTTAPTVSITNPVAGSTVSGTTSVTATASDDVGVTEVRFFADGSLIGTDTEAPYEASWDTATVADGSHELTASALDAAGNVGSADPVTVSVDNTAEPPPAETTTTTFADQRIDDEQTRTHTVSSGAGTVEWTLDWDDGRVDLDLRGRDPAGNVVFFDSGSARPKNGSFTAAVSGDYTFEVINSTDRNTDYTLSVTHPVP